MYKVIAVAINLFNPASLPSFPSNITLPPLYQYVYISTVRFSQMSMTCSDECWDYRHAVLTCVCICIHACNLHGFDESCISLTGLCTLLTASVFNILWLHAALLNTCIIVGHWQYSLYEVLIVCYQCVGGYKDDSDDKLFSLIHCMQILQSLLSITPSQWCKLVQNLGLLVGLPMKSLIILKSNGIIQRVLLL